MAKASEGCKLARDRLVVSAVSGAVAWLRLNRPNAMNALSNELLDDLDDALDFVASTPAIRVVVLTGTGRAFCTGADLKLGGFAEKNGAVNSDKLLAHVRRASATLDRIPALAKPVIAAINGYALAGGFELMLVCDIVIAAQSARIGDAHSNYGLLPGGGGAARLVRRVGPSVAKYLAFTGDFLPAPELLPFGLVNEVVADDALRDRVDKLAEQIASRSPRGIAHMKRLIDDGLDQPLATALRLEQQALEVHAHSLDMREGLAAFREKRQPRYTGR